MPTLWSSEIDKVILEHVKVAESDYDYMLQRFKKKSAPLKMLLWLLEYLAVF